MEQINNNNASNPEDDFPTVSLPGAGSGDSFEMTQIGPYKLVRTLGEGGFGYVFLADQQEPIKRQVALKLIKPGMDTKRVIARFEAERQALALLNHPHIAKVFDAGSTDEGRPYFVMEYVEGIPITDYCDQKKLSIKKRLELFIRVCEAIHHAHQKGIIHRDIKPAMEYSSLLGRPIVGSKCSAKAPAGIRSSSTCRNIPGQPSSRRWRALGVNTPSNGSNNRVC